MKPDSWLGDLARGEWWLPDRPDKKVPGIVIRRSERLRLELIGAFDERPAEFGLSRYPMICGWLSSGGPVTLFNCSSTKQFNAPGMLTEQCSFGRAIRGYNFSNPGEAVFDSLSAHVDGLFSWLGISGLEVSYSLGERPPFEWSAIFKRPVPLRWRTRDGNQLCVWFTARISGGGAGQSKLSLAQDTLVEVKVSTPQEFSALHEEIFRFQLLMKLLSGLDMHTTLHSCTSPSTGSEEDGRPVNLMIEVSQPSDSGADERADEPSWMDMLVPYPDIATKLEELIVRWAELEDSLGRVIAASLSDRRNDPAQVRFLTLANALLRHAEYESDSRVDFATGTRDVIGRYCSPEVLQRVVRILADTRHYYTHFNPVLADRAARGAELVNLVELLDVVNRAALLERLGFERGKVLAWINKSPKFSRRMLMNMWEDL